MARPKSQPDSFHDLSLHSMQDHVSNLLCPAGATVTGAAP
jgi:hypothetical protein